MRELSQVLRRNPGWHGGWIAAVLLSVCPGALWRTAVAGGALPPPVALALGHVDLGVEYAPGEAVPLALQVVDEDAVPPRRIAATNAVLVVAESARRELPADIPPLGVAGDPVWLLPASQSEDLLYLGVSAEGLPAAGFVGNLEMRLLGVEGPGHFFLWQAEAGGLTFSMNSRDGFGPDDRFLQLVGGHSHANWGFTQPGVYRLILQASGRVQGSTTNVLSEPTAVTFHVLPLPAAEPTPFERWQAAAWPGESDAARIAPGADPDADGRANLLEYAQGTDPNRVDAVPADWMQCVVEGVGEARRAGVQVRRPASATDLTLGLVGAESLAGPWLALESVAGAPVEAAADAILETRWDPRVMLGRNAGWYRLSLGLKSASQP
jgi:surface-anchored protein